MSLKRKKKLAAEPVLDASNKRFSAYSFSELKIPAMPVMDTDYEAEVEQKLSEMALAGRAIDSSNYVGRSELLGERLQTVPEFKVPAAPPPLPQTQTQQQQTQQQQQQALMPEGLVPVPSSAGVLPVAPPLPSTLPSALSSALPSGQPSGQSSAPASTLPSNLTSAPPPPPPSVTQQRLYRRSMSSALPHYCSLERRPRAATAATAAATRPVVWMTRSQSFTDVYQKSAAAAAAAAELGRPPLRGGGRAEDRERRNSLRRSMRALSGSWRNLLKQVGGMHRANKPAQIRRVPPPTVPEVSSHRHSGSSFSSGYGSLGQPDSRSSCGDETLLPPHSPLDLPPSPGPDSAEGSMYTGSNRLSAGSSAGLSPGPQAGFNTFSFPTAAAPRAVAPPGGPAGAGTGSGSGKEFVPHFHNHLYQHQQSDDQGIDVQSPGRDSPSSAGSSTSSFGCRNSTSSLDSGRASSAYDSKASHPPSLNRLSGQSYESAGSYRQSYHSSSSSLGSLEKDDAISRLHVAQMLADGMKDSEVLNAWLTDFHFEEYYQLFVNAGYDMPTVSRMTPEDLTAIGITKPAHRRKLKAEIARLNISDGLPDFIPESLDGWLRLLRLGDYGELLRAQGYTSVPQATEITWEDLEEIGISRLGHQKKITLAIKRAKDILTGKRVPSQYQHQYTTQEIAIPASASPTEPTYHQLKTFQQHGWADPAAAAAAAAAGRYQGYSQYRPLPLQQVQVQVESAADAGDEPPPPPAPQTQLQYFEQQRYVLQAPAGWRRSYEDGDLTPTNEPPPATAAEGAGTLPRPRPTAAAAAAARPRPVAKIVAKTRDAEPAGERDAAPVKLTRHYGSLPRDPLKRAEALGSAAPPTFSTPQGTPRRPVPAPPRRDSLRAEALAAARQDFPPPPLPLVVRDSADTSDASDCESASPATCRAARNDSSASFKSTSSTESDSFPFANDNAGTIKQRTQRSHTTGDLPSSLSAKSGRPPAAGSGAPQGDVLNDIGSMLADLTDELDAMLELEADAP